MARIGRDTQAVTRVRQSSGMNTNTFVPNPVIALDCPACDGSILVDQLDLDGEIRCEGCLVAFSLAEPVAGTAALEAIAAWARAQRGTWPPITNAPRSDLDREKPAAATSRPLPISRSVAPAADAVEEHAGRDHPDRLEADREGPGGRADPPEELVRGGRRAQGDVGDHDARRGGPDDERGREAGRRPGR